MISVLSLLPCVFWVALSLGDINLSLITLMHGQSTQWSQLLSFVVWLNIGWVGLGALAGQVKDQIKTYPKATTLLFMISCLVNVMPVVISVSQHNLECDPSMTLFEP